jgi:hypothetical protein
MEMGMIPSYSIFLLNYIKFRDAGQLPGFPELSPAVYGGGQVQTSYRRHGES